MVVRDAQFIASKITLKLALVKKFLLCSEVSKSPSQSDVLGAAYLIESIERESESLTCEITEHE